MAKDRVCSAVLVWGSFHVRGLRRAGVAQKPGVFSDFAGDSGHKPTDRGRLVTFRGGLAVFSGQNETVNARRETSNGRRDIVDGRRAIAGGQMSTARSHFATGSSDLATVRGRRAGFRVDFLIVRVDLSAGSLNLHSHASRVSRLISGHSFNSSLRINSYRGSILVYSCLSAPGLHRLHKAGAAGCAIPGRMSYHRYSRAPFGFNCHQA